MKVLTNFGWFIVKKGRKKRSKTSIKHLRPETKAEFASHLRQNMTAAEKKLWFDLKPRGFLAQQIVRGYIPDFFHPKKGIVIEVDGSIHATQKDRDSQKDDRLTASGYKVLRFSNKQVFFDGKSVLASIDAMLK